MATSYRLPGDWRHLTLVGANLSDQNAISMNEFRGMGYVQQGVAVLGLMARYDVNKQVRVSLNVQNLTDKQYINLSGFSTYVTCTAIRAMRG